MQPATSPSLHPAAGPALAMLQLTDVPAGLRALDGLVKEAPVQIFATGTVQSGHYLIAFGGQVEAVVRSFDRAVAIAGASLADRVLLADAEPRILPAFRDGAVRWGRAEPPGDALGVVQCGSCPVLLAAIDGALKGALVDLVELRVGDGLGGKSLATLWGEIHDVEAALELACAAIVRQQDRGFVTAASATTSIIPNADPDVRRAVAAGTRFFREWRG